MTKKDLEKQIELLVKDDERSQQTIINQRQEIERLNKEIEDYQKELEKADSITQSCIFEGKEEATKNIRVCFNELERLNNIINELENWLKKEIFDLNGDYDYEGVVSGYENVLNKLQELKGSDKE
jgi:hypothetical protein